MLTSRATANVATARSDVFFGRGRTSGARTLRRAASTVGLRTSPKFGGRKPMAIRADAASELEEGQIEGVRVARARDAPDR